MFALATLTTFSSSLVLAVASISFVLTILTWIAANRMGQTKVRFVAAAFGVHFLKSTIVAYGLFTRNIGHEVLEVVEAAFDFAMITLLAIPFLWRR